MWVKEGEGDAEGCVAVVLQGVLRGAGKKFGFCRSGLFDENREALPGALDFGGRGVDRGVVEECEGDAEGG